MCFRIVVGHREEDLIAAQWDVVIALQMALESNWQYPEASQAMRLILQAARAKTETPQICMAAFARSLLGKVAQLQKMTESADVHTVERLRREVASYRRIVSEFQANPLRAQVEELAQERDRLQSEVDRLTNQVRNLEGTLAQAQAVHRSEKAQARQEIADLNRIVAEQQEALDTRSS